MTENEVKEFKETQEILKEHENQKNQENQEMVHHTLYDDVFKTICSHMKPLLIHVINEMFGKNFEMGTDEYERYANEHMKLAVSHSDDPKVSKVISDFYIKLNGVIYHVECQSTDDGDILVRILDYSLQMALDNAKLNKETGDIRVQIPHSALIKIRNKDDNEPKLTEKTITYFFEDRSIDVKVPILNVQAYSLEEIFEKRFYLAVPYYVLRFEKNLKLIKEKPIENAQEYDKIIDELNKMFVDLTEASNKGELPVYYLLEITNLYRKVANVVSVNLNDQMKERMVDAMGGTDLGSVCQKLYKDGYDKAIEDSKKEIAMLKEQLDSVLAELAAIKKEQSNKTVT